MATYHSHIGFLAQSIQQTELNHLYITFKHLALYSLSLWYMMTSSDGNIFRITGPWCGKFTGHPHKAQWRGALMFSLIWAWMNGWVDYGEADDLRRHHSHPLWRHRNDDKFTSRISYHPFTWFTFGSMNIHLHIILFPCTGIVQVFELPSNWIKILTSRTLGVPCLPRQLVRQ